MAIETGRGSDKVLAAWKSRTLTEEAVAEIAMHLEKSPATVDGVAVSGGENATGVRVSLSYDGDDVPWCGNDIQFWLNWLRHHGGGAGVVTVPRIIINGIPWVDSAQVVLDFGHVAELGE